jgi:hypothetical protein
MAKTTTKKPAASPLWKGEALKVQRRTLNAINAAMRKGHISDLGRAAMKRDPDAQLTCYAKAMGWTLEQAREAVQRHAAHLARYA